MMQNGQPCAQCKFGMLIHEILHCLGAHYNADFWVPGPVDHVYPSVPAEVLPNLTSFWEECNATSSSSPVSGCAMSQGDPYDPLGWPSHTLGSEPQAKVKWHYGWIQTNELHIAEAWGHALRGYGERVRLVAHDFGEESLAAVTAGGESKSNDGGPKLALVAESESYRTDVPRTSVAKDWLWIEYKANYNNVFEADTA